MEILGMDELVGHLEEEGARLADAAQAAGAGAAVPTCPEWNVGDLLRHISGVHRWAATYVVADNPDPPTDESQAPLFAAPAEPELLSHYQAGHRALVDALRQADPARASWTFLPEPVHSNHFWARRQAHETAIHRVDAERAVGRPSSCHARLAADGIDELLCGFYARPGGRLRADPPVTLAVSAEDVGVSWSLLIEPDRRLASRQVTADADCTLTGPAADLYLLLWNRLDLIDSTVRVEGSGQVLQLWRDKAAVRWS